jgi:hypothetical protein
MIKSYKPNKQAIIVRNPNFDASMFGGNVPAGNPDKMTIDIFGDAGIALTRTLQGQEDYDFYSGKVMAAKHFVSYVLPGVHAKIGAMIAGDRSALDMSDGAFSTAY